MSRYYCYIGKYELAKKYIMPSLKDIEPQDTSAVYASVADVYRLAGKEDSASYYFNKIKNNGTIYAKEVAYRFFTRTGIERKGDKKILEDFDIYNSYIDSVRSVTSTEALAKANALYNYQLREVENIPVPAGKTVRMQPGWGYHLMLMDLKGQVKEGDQVPLTLTIENKDGSRRTLELTAPARPLNAPMPMQHGKH